MVRILHIGSGSGILRMTSSDILVAGEMGTQTATPFAREMDPNGKRTICKSHSAMLDTAWNDRCRLCLGVVTKAGMVDRGSIINRRLWQEIFEGPARPRLLRGEVAEG